MEAFRHFVDLMRLGLGLSEEIPQSLTRLLAREDEEKNRILREVFRLSMEQGFPSILYDGLQKVFTAGHYQMDEDLGYDWFGTCLAAEMAFAAQEKTLSFLAAFYNHYGLEMMLIKGFGLCPLYPQPNHRPLGDIDIWLFGRIAEGDKLLAGKLGIEISRDKEHHTVFTLNGIMVENHYEFLNARSHRTNRLFNEALEKLGREDYRVTQIGRGRVCLPSPTFNAIFLFRHLAQHYMGAGINLRQVSDWVLFLNRDAARVDWNLFSDLVTRSGCQPFFRALMGLSVHFFGLSVSSLPPFERAEAWETQLLEDILSDNAAVRGDSLRDRLARFGHQRRKISLVIQESAPMTFLRTGVQSLKYSLKK